ncbi:MAG: ankyrin repeat domain-containing protein [Fimbriimonas sp.]|nr:ankyrin repeat domain-containing protein [Fimbriimonas sp.]
MMRSILTLFSMLLVVGGALIERCEAASFHRFPQYVIGPIPRNSPDFDPDEDIPGAQALLSYRRPHVSFVSFTHLKPFRFSPDGQWMWVTFGSVISNDCCRQLAEVDLACRMIILDPRQELYRSSSIVFRRFNNSKIPHVGALEAFGLADPALVGEYRIPCKYWRTDTTFEIIATRIVPVEDEQNLHDMGNLIQYIAVHHTADVERAILKDPALLRLKNSEGTNLMLATMAFGTPRLARFVISHGGDIHSLGKHGEDAMYYASSGGQPALLDFALKHGCPVDSSHPSALIHATRENVASSVSWLIAHRANVNRPDAEGYTAIARAVAYRNMGIYNRLEDAKPNLRVRTKEGNCLMELALGTQVYLKRLWQAGAPIDEPNPKTKMTPFLTSVAEGNYRDAKWLLDHGAKLKSKDIHGHDVFYFARRANTFHTEKFFRDEVGDLRKYGGK